MKVVVDTNVFISSFFGGHPRRIIDLWKTGGITLCLTNSILDEYLSVLKRMGLAGAGELDDLLYLFRSGSHCLFTAKTPTLKISVDPDDDKFLEAAVALSSECIVSGDRDLLVLEEYLGIPILKPKAFLEAYRG